MLSNYLRSRPINDAAPILECLPIVPALKMPNWYYDKKDLKNTPSIRDGLDFDTDRRYRKEGARFIMECGTKMGLGHNTMATGVVYFHRFYVFHSFKSFPRYVTACCCLLLAGKVEETPKKCRDIIRIARTMLSDQKFQSFGEDPKEEVMTLERILLQTIKFDLQVEHPYSFLVKYAKCLKGDQVKLQKMVQMAWNFVNDSLTTTVCLQWEPEIIAVALIHLASKLSKFMVTKWDGQQPSHVRWWDMFVADVTMEILEDICHQVLDLYQQPNQMGMDSPPQLPPSKSSPPAKHSKISPTFAKSSPPVAGINPQPPNLPRPSIDEKIESMQPIQRVHQMNLGTGTAYQAAAFAAQQPPSYGTMFQQFGPPPSMQHPPPIVSQPPPPPQPMYGSAPPGPGGPYQSMPNQYQPGGGPPPHHSSHQNFYPTMPPNVRGYYQGPP